jgi:DMSO/TMAO reductase YedYZ heme-binding membrane subunit
MQNGKLAFILIAVHIILIKSVYESPLTLPFVWLAAIAFTILVATVGTAIMQKRLPYKVWRRIHLLNYTVAAFAIWHQLAKGGDFLVSNFFGGYWVGLTVVVVANLLYFRVFKPLWFGYQAKKTS